jgi:sec-independent protein translocase protein TatA
MQLLAFIGPMEMLIVGIVVLLLFGSRLPSVARSIGKSVTEFKKGVNGIEDDSPDARKLER